MHNIKKNPPIIHKDQNISEAITRITKSKIKMLLERIIGNIKYQEYLLKPPSVKELERK